MKKIIGGLLVISLLSRPSLLKLDYIAYEIYKASDQIIKNIRTIQEQDEGVSGEICYTDIDDAFDGIDRNNKGISTLLKDLKDVTDKIGAVMHNKSRAGEAMSEEQMTAFSSFSTYYSGETDSLNTSLYNINSDMASDDLKSEILSGDTNLAQLYGQLQSISNHQLDAISNIISIIQAANETLCVIA